MYKVSRSWYLLTFLLPLAATAQRRVVHQQLVWAGYYNTILISDRFSVLSDAQLRTKNWVGQWSQQLVRSGVSYHVNKRVTATAGFAFFRTAQTVNEEALFKKEYRPWQEVSFRTDRKAVSFIQRLRVEQRFLQQVANDKLTSDYGFIVRLRYKADLQWSIPKTALAIGAGNEVMVNPAKLNSADFFDQNRASASLFWKVAPGINLQWQYIKLIQKKYGVNVLENGDVFRFNVHHQLKWKNK